VQLTGGVKSLAKKCPDYRRYLPKKQSNCGFQKQRRADCTFHDEEPRNVPDMGRSKPAP
jgi:hypothetical protein